MVALVTVDALDPSRSRARGAGCRRSGSSASSRSGTPPRTSWTSPRSTPACTPSTSPGCGGGLPDIPPLARDRRAVPAAAGRRSRAPTDGPWRPWSCPTTARSRASTTGRSWRTPSWRCGCASTTAFMRAGVTMIDPRPRFIDATRGAGRGRHPRGRVSSCGAPRASAGTRVIRAGSQLFDSRRRGALRHLGQRARVGRRRGRRAHRARSRTSRPGAHVGRRRRGRQLRRDQGRDPRRALQAASLQLPRRRRDRRGRQHRRGHHHRQLRRPRASTGRSSATARSSARTPSCGRR